MPVSILKKLGLVAEAEVSAQSGLVSAIEQRLSHLEPARAHFVATFAGLLARVAFADDDVSEAEAHRIRLLVAEHGGLDDPEAETVALIARTRVGGTDDHILTRRFNAVATESEKRSLIDCLYAVATADDLVSHVEDREVRRIGEALMLPSSKVLEIRSRYREKLEELRLLRQVRERKP